MFYFFAQVTEDAEKYINYFIKYINISQYSTVNLVVLHDLNE
jgi:hypothetical protein